MRRRVERVAEELQHGRLAIEAGKAKLLATRGSVVEDWRMTAGLLWTQGEQSLAQGVETYARRMPAVATEKELVAAELLTRLGLERDRVRSGERDHFGGDRS
jgi:hypothetical protein